MSTRSKHTVFLDPRVRSDNRTNHTLAYMEWYLKEPQIHRILFLCYLKEIRDNYNLFSRTIITTYTS